MHKTINDIKTAPSHHDDVQVEEGECDGTIDLTESSQEDIDPPGEEVTSLSSYQIHHP